MNKVILGLLLIMPLSVFALREGTYHKITVTCWVDANENGEIDADEVGVPGVLYRLKHIEGDSLIAKHQTNAHGRAVFKVNLHGGSYELYIETGTLPADYAITAGSTSYTFESAYRVDLQNPQDQNGQLPSLRRVGGVWKSFDLGITSEMVDGSGEPVIEQEPPLPGNTLVFVNGSPTFLQGQKPGLWEWANLTDGNTEDVNKDAALFPFSPDNHPWAIFEFADCGMYKFNYVTMQGAVDSYGEWQYYHENDIAMPFGFQVFVSTTGMADEDFELAGTYYFEFMADPHGKVWFKNPTGYATAKYVKLVIIAGQPYRGVVKTASYTVDMSITEFNVETGAKQGAVPAVHTDSVQPQNYQLGNYPNPFNPRTTIQYRLSKAERVSLDIYSLNGRKVAQLVNSVQAAGSHSVVWDASDMPSGIYLYKLSAGDFSKIERMILVK